ncbi:MAG: NAD(P)/FAD-dependent oxidoreductase [Candidatus Omnitrophota bacterium]
MKNVKIVIVGGGPAGMMAGIRAGRDSRGVILIERNAQAGRKLLLTGNGRCNITNMCGLDDFIGKFGKNGQFLRDAFREFFNTDLLGFFKERGLEFRTEELRRVFPADNKASSVLAALKKELAANKVAVLYSSRVKDIIVKDSRVRGVILACGETIKCGSVILATGGLSYGATGSTGDGFEIARGLGHRIVPQRPGLVPLYASQPFVKKLEGLALSDVSLKICSGKNKAVAGTGDILFTAGGISGPLALTSSGRISGLLDENKTVYVELDLMPGLPLEELDRIFIKSPGMDAKKSVKNSLRNFLPERLAELFLDLSSIDRDKRTNQLTQKERKQLTALCKSFRLDISRTGPIEKAMITKGGVSLKDVDPRTMASRLVKGLYFAGEILDIDADTGGFNLQAAFSTGHLAGKSAAAA